MGMLGALELCEREDRKALSDCRDLEASLHANNLIVQLAALPAQTSQLSTASSADASPSLTVPRPGIETSGPFVIQAYIGSLTRYVIV
jgi:hypothetical protein